MFSDVQLYIIGITASVIVWVIRYYVKKAGKPVPEGVLTLGVYVVSAGLAAWWHGATFPPFPVCSIADPGACALNVLGYVTALLEVLGGYVAFAALIYQVLLKKVLEIYIPTIIKRARMAFGQG